jgi:hypothetical protein
MRIEGGRELRECNGSNMHDSTADYTVKDNWLGGNDWTVVLNFCFPYALVISRISISPNQFTIHLLIQYSLYSVYIVSNIPNTWWQMMFTLAGLL